MASPRVSLGGPGTTRSHRTRYGCVVAVRLNTAQRQQLAAYGEASGLYDSTLAAHLVIEGLKRLAAGEPALSHVPNACGINVTCSATGPKVGGE